jgi:hypothetical protein
VTAIVELVDAGAVARGNLARAIGRACIHHDDFIDVSSDRSKAVVEVFFFVTNDHGERELGHLRDLADVAQFIIQVAREDVCGDETLGTPLFLGECAELFLELRRNSDVYNF